MADDVQIEPLDGVGASGEPRASATTYAPRSAQGGQPDQGVQPQQGAPAPPRDRVEVGPDARQPEPPSPTSHLAALRAAHRPPTQNGQTSVIDPGKRIAGGNTAEYQKFYLNHGNNYNIDCNGACAYGKPSKKEEPGLCEGTAALAHASTRTKLPDSAQPQKSDGEYAHAPIDAAAAVQRASEQQYSLVSEHKGQPHQVMDKVLEEVKKHGSSILGMGFTNPDGTPATGHAVLVTDVTEGKAAYTKPDGTTEPRNARIFHYLDPNHKDGVPENGKQQAIVHFTDTNQVSWTRDVREFYASQATESDRSVPQRGEYLRKGELDMGTMSDTQVANLVRRLKQGADYRATNAD